MEGVRCVDMPLIHNREGRTFVGTPKKKGKNIFYDFLLMRRGRAYYMVVRYKFPSGLATGWVL